MNKTKNSWSEIKGNEPDIIKNYLSKLSLRVRNDQLNIFYKYLSPTKLTKLIDVGVSSVENLKDTNFFEKNYKFPENLLAASIDEPLDFPKKYPKIKFKKIISGSNLPFADKKFNIAVSWATLEHVGNKKLQKQFLEDLASSQPQGHLIYDRTRGNLQHKVERLKVYQNNYYATLIKTLANIYPVTARLLGKTYFGILARNFMALYPSQTRNLNEYGFELPQFILSLQANPDHEMVNLPYLGEVANFELAVHRILFSVSNSLFDFQAFTKVGIARQGTLIFKLAENSACLFSQFPLDKTRPFW